MLPKTTVRKWLECGTCFRKNGKYGSYNYILAKAYIQLKFGPLSPHSSTTLTHSRSQSNGKSGRRKFGVCKVDEYPHTRHSTATLMPVSITVETCRATCQCIRSLCAHIQTDRINHTNTCTHYVTISCEFAW